MCQIDAPKVAVRLVSIRHAIWKLFQTIGRGVTNVPPRPVGRELKRRNVATPSLAEEHSQRYETCRM